MQYDSSAGGITCIYVKEKIGRNIEYTPFKIFFLLFQIFVCMLSSKCVLL